MPAAAVALAAEFPVAACGPLDEAEVPWNDAPVLLPIVPEAAKN